MEFEKGQEVLVANNTPVYSTYDSKIKCDTIKGTYWIYSATIKNNRIRVTDSYERAFEPCSMAGWIDINNIIPENKEEKVEEE